MSHNADDSKIADDADTELVLSLINEPTSTGKLFLPGASAASSALLVEKLKHNYLHNNAFFQGDIFHNIKAKFYNAYMIYFCKALKATSSPTEVLPRFLFSPAFNHDANLAIDAQQPHRLMGAVYHPLINIGCGVELGIQQQVAEGLAQTAIHPAYQSNAYSPEMFTMAEPVLSEARLTPEAPDLPFEEKPGVQTFTAVVAAGAANVVGELATAWYDPWTVGLNDEELEDRLEDMVEDAILTMTLIYGASGFAAKGDRVFNADFITMHFVTSMNFVPTFALRPDTGSTWPYSRESMTIES